MIYYLLTPVAVVSICYCVDACSFDDTVLHAIGPRLFLNVQYMAVHETSKLLIAVWNAMMPCPFEMHHVRYSCQQRQTDVWMCSAVKLCRLSDRFFC